MEAQDDYRAVNEAIMKQGMEVNGRDVEPIILDLSAQPWREKELIAVLVAMVRTARSIMSETVKPA